MLQYSPSGSLDTYYFMGGILNPIHYGSYFNDMDAFCDIMAAEEAHILASRKTRRINVDLYETNLTPAVRQKLCQHFARISSRITKLGIYGADAATRRALKKHLIKGGCLGAGQLWFHRDPEVLKAWTVA